MIKSTMDIIFLFCCFYTAIIIEIFKEKKCHNGIYVMLLLFFKFRDDHADLFRCFWYVENALPR
jgi:hypothetical protein